MDSVILKVENVRKEYILGVVTGGTLADTFRERRKKPSGTVRNKKFTALENVSFSICKGETVGLIGSNGAGKSTLLKLISRITAPTDGRILINGRVASMLEVGTGFHQELTGRENIYLNGAILGMSRKEIDEKIDSIIAFSECEEFIDTPVKRYSSGMYVKLAFAVAAHLDAEIMIMDEVLAVGDIKFQNKCLNKMKEIAETEGRTIIYVSHNMDTIHKLCKRCIVLNHGRIVFDGESEKAVQIYRGDLIRQETCIDLTKYFRPGWLARDDVRLTWAEYPKKEDNKMPEERMELLLRWKVRSNVANMGVRIELLDETEKPFATAVFYDIFTGKSEDTGEKIFCVDLRGVMNGRYQTFYTLFCVDSYGQSIDLDCVRGLNFEINKEQNNVPMKWKNQSWGNIKLKEDIRKHGK